MNFESHLMRKIFSVTLGSIILIYILYQVFNNSFIGITTQTAILTNMDEAIAVSAWFTREEVAVESNKVGITSFVKTQGEKVAKGDVVAQVFYTEGSATDQRQIERLENEIKSLEKLVNSSGFYSTESELLGVQINEEIVNLNIAVSNMEFDDVTQYRNSLQYLISKKNIVTEQEDTAAYLARIAQLESEKEKLELGSVSTINAITAKRSGYFVPTLDGYENFYDIEKIADITVSDIDNIKSNSDYSQTAAKIVCGFDWYVVTTITEQEKIQINDRNNIAIRILSTDTQDIPAQIIAMNKDEETGNYALVLKCDYNIAEIIGMRNEEIQLILQEHEGVLLDTKSIHFQNIEETIEDENGNTSVVVHENIMGVYVKYGQKISFVQVFVEMYTGDYALCKLSLTDEEKALVVADDVLELYDEVVVKGKDLYDGKIL